ncbi:variable surface protein [Plasmodium gonderi]|uniref:Variable surface protein n=1 Tax=Plasmodium gonderi TaxID=77519 RepID=A0A1Y1JPT8_PLAGO|nr:variable surface protein [Plasmodium gonderi]GAW84491.1 variable surface protein [Plasmodium gonderi]
MSETVSYKNIRFDIIFPECRIDFNKTITDWSNFNNIRAELYALCNDFLKTFVKYEQMHNFTLQTSCTGLGLFLYYIAYKNKSNASYKELACKYFNYKLQDMLKNYEFIDNDPKTGYNNLKQYWAKLTKNDTSFLDICNNVLHNLEASAFDIFKYFDKLYFFLPLIKNDNLCSENAGKFKGYVNNLKVYVSENNSIRTLLNNLIRDYNGRIHKSALCDNDLSLVEISVTESSEREISVPEISVPEISVPKSSPKGNGIKDNMMIQAIQIKHSGLSIGIWVGIVVFSSAILIMAYIIYKYTRNALFIRRRVKKLKKLLNINIENRNNVMGSSEEIYKNRINMQYKIAYV